MIDEKIRERLFAFWHGEIIDRCCVSIRVKKGDVYRHTIDGSDTSDGFQLFDPERIVARGRRKFENTILFGDALPALLADFGTAGHAAYFGCPYSLASDSIWFEPMLGKSDSLVYDPSNEFLQSQINVLNDVVEMADDAFILAMPDNCGSIDALAHLRGTENLLVDMIEREDVVLGWLDAVLNAWEHGNTELRRVLRKQALPGTVHGWMSSWSPGFHMQLQCDFAAMISPAMFETFVMPELERSLRTLDNSIYHLDGVEQVAHLDHILSLEKLDAVQWVPVAGQPSTTDSLEHLIRIQRAGKGLVLFPEPDEVPTLLDALSARKLLLNVNEVASIEEAESLLAYVERHGK